jgi:hypothetical protein
MTFIKLTNPNGEILYLNLGRVLFITSIRREKELTTAFIDGDTYSFKETPEQFMALIEQANTTKGVV